MKQEIEKYCYRKNSFFNDFFPFAIRRVSNRTEDFNLARRFHRQFWKITYITEGKGSYVIGKQRIPFVEKSIVVTHPDAETTWEIDGEELQLFNLVFDRSFLSGSINQACDNYHFLKIFSEEYSTEYESPMFLLTADRKMDVLIRSIYQEFEDSQPNRELMIRLKFQELILLIMRRVQNRHHRNPDWTVQFVISYIQHHFKEEISLKQMAQTLELSPERLCRMFREKKGCSLMQQVMKIRIGEARRLLAATSLPCPEIAKQAGFRNLSYFYRIFSGKCGISPERFRQQQKQTVQN